MATEFKQNHRGNTLTKGSAHFIRIGLILNAMKILSRVNGGTAIIILMANGVELKDIDSSSKSAKFPKVF